MAKPLIWETLLLATALSAGPHWRKRRRTPPAGNSDAGADAAATRWAIDVGCPASRCPAVRERNIQQATTQVVSVLSTEDIARTGEGDIAGALAA